MSEFTGGNLCGKFLGHPCVAFVVVRAHEADRGIFDLVGRSIISISNSLLTVPANDAGHASSASVTALVAASIASAPNVQLPNGSPPVAGVCNGSSFRIFGNLVEVAAGVQRPDYGLAAVAIDITPFTPTSSSNSAILVSENSAFFVTGNSVA